MGKIHRVLSAFGLNVRKQREARKLTQERLAEKADLDPTYISGIALNKSEIPLGYARRIK